MLSKDIAAVKGRVLNLSEDDCESCHLGSA